MAWSRMIDHDPRAAGVPAAAAAEPYAIPTATIDKGEYVGRSDGKLYAIFRTTCPHCLAVDEMVVPHNQIQRVIGPRDSLASVMEVMFSTPWPSELWNGRARWGLIRRCVVASCHREYICSLD